MTIPACRSWRRTTRPTPINARRSPISEPGIHVLREQAATGFKENINQYVKALNEFHEAFSNLSQDVTNRAQTLSNSKNT
jgi:hypothetical protein